jgi:hypothetical protein
MTLNTQAVAWPTGTDELYMLAVQIPDEQASSYITALHSAYTPQRVTVKDGISLMSVDGVCFVVFCRDRACDTATVGYPLTRLKAARLLASTLEHTRGGSPQIGALYDALIAEQDIPEGENEKEGWELTPQGRIRHLESSPQFTHQKDAEWWVVTQAGKGSVRHAEALTFDQRMRPEAC